MALVFNAIASVVIAAIAIGQLPKAIVAQPILRNFEIVVAQQNAEYFYKQGLAKAKQGDYKGAIADYTKAIQLDPAAATTYSRRATARDRIGDKKGAAEDRKISASLPPEPSSRGFELARTSRGCADTSNSSSH